MSYRSPARPRARVMAQLSASVLALSAVVWAGPGLAQSNASGSAAMQGDTIETVTVTAQFRSQNIQNTPLAITAVSGATLEARSQESVTDLGTYSPNVNLSESSSLYGNAVTAFIRGIGQFSSNFALEPGVGIYVDDVYFGTTFGANFDLTDLDRVEILRGPQGTLAGMNSIGGAVKLYTKKPNGEDHAFLQAGYGNYGTVDVKGSADFTIADGLYARVSGFAKRSDGYLTDLDYGCTHPGSGIAASPKVGGSCKIGTEGGKDVKGIRAQLRYAPAGSRLEANLSADYTVDNSEPVATKLVYANNPNVRSYDAANPFAGVPFDSRFITPKNSYTSYATYSNGGNYTTIFGIPYQVVPGSFNAGRKNSATGYGIAGTIDYRFNDSLSLKSITAYRRATGEYSLDIDGSPLDLADEFYRMSHSQFTQELRLNGNWGKLLDFTVGGYYYKANDRLQNRVEIPLYLYDFLSNDPVSNESKSGFAHVEVHLADGLNLIGGLRYTQQDKSYTFHRRNPDGTLPSGAFFTPNFLLAGLDGLKGTYSGDHLDYRVGVNYRWNDNVMTYVQVSTGIKGGGINPIPYVPDQVVPFGPEKLTTYEAGYKLDFWDDKVRLDGAFFYNVYKDIQMTLYYCANSVSTACGETANAGSAHIKGAELEGSVRPFPGLQIDGSLAYLDFKYNKVNPVTGVTLGMVAPFNSKWQASLGVQYTADIGSAGTLTPRLDWSYRSSFYFNAINGPWNKIQGNNMFNARVTYEPLDSKWQFGVSVKNLFDRFHYIGANDNISAYGVVTKMVAPPRMWLLTVRRDF